MLRANFAQKNIAFNHILDLLKQGLTPEKIVLGIAFGVTLGVIPVLGSTTLLCAIAAFLFRLNPAAIQLVNYLVYPLQILLLIPFYRAGEHLFRAEVLPLSVSQVLALINEDFWGAVRLLWDTTVHAVVVWGILAPILGVILYAALLPLVRRLPLKVQNAGQTKKRPEGSQTGS
ncbi:MAG: DUF2062 domain-containing protein [bacterium]